MLSNTVLIRADGSKDIGTGHVMRCLCLAEELSVHALKPVFCTKPFSGALVSEIEARGYEVFQIPVDADAETDVSYFRRTLEQYNCRAAITDGYHFDAFYLGQIRGGVDVLLSIDDIAGTFYCSDIVLNQNINASREMYEGKTADNTRLLLGPHYALLRSEFRKLATVKRDFEEVHNVLVTFGGADRDNQTLKTLKAMEEIERDFSVTAVLGYSNEYADSVREYAASSGREIEVLRNADNMSELMVKADLAVTSGGSTSWELCCLGLPALQIILAENQADIVEELDRREMTVNLGWYDRVTGSDISSALLKLIDDRNMRITLSRNGQSAVDGKGVQRVALEIVDRLNRKHKGLSI